MEKYWYKTMPVMYVFLITERLIMTLLSMNKSITTVYEKNETFMLLVYVLTNYLTFFFFPGKPNAPFLSITALLV